MSGPKVEQLESLVWMVARTARIRRLFHIQRGMSRPLSIGRPVTIGRRLETNIVLTDIQRRAPPSSRVVNLPHVAHRWTETA